MRHCSCAQGTNIFGSMSAAITIQMQTLRNISTHIFFQALLLPLSNLIVQCFFFLSQIVMISNYVLLYESYSCMIVQSAS